MLIEKLRDECGYDPDQDGSVDDLIAYKDALEDLLARVDEAARENAYGGASAADVTGALFNMGFGEKKKPRPRRPWHTTSFDALKALSLARTALTDPDGVDDLRGDEPIGYAVDRIDEVIGAYSFEKGAGNDDASQLAWVIAHAARILAECAEAMDHADERECVVAEGLADVLDRLDDVRDLAGDLWREEA